MNCSSSGPDTTRTDAALPLLSTPASLWSARTTRNFPTCGRTDFALTENSRIVSIVTLSSMP